MSSVSAPSVCVTCRDNWPLRRGWVLLSQVNHQTPSHWQPAPAPASTRRTYSADGLLRDSDLLSAGRLRSWQSHHGALPLPALLSGKEACKKERPHAHGNNSLDCSTFPSETLLPTPEPCPGLGAGTRRQVPPYEQGLF